MRPLDAFPAGCRRLFFDWGVSDHYSWGIVGYNLMRYGGDSGAFRPLPVLFPMRFLAPLDPIELAVFSQYEALAKGQVVITAEDVLLRCHGLIISTPHAHLPSPQIAYIFCEKTAFSPDEVEALNAHAGVIAGSQWAAEVLTEAGVRNVHVHIQGVDEEFFFPRAKRLYTDRFVIFSGGQLSLRKGQDQLIKALVPFLAEHPDALLLAMWRSHWEEVHLPTVNRSGLLPDLHHTAEGEQRNEILRWLQECGLNLDQVVLLETTAQRYLPHIYREVDVTVVPSRCEGGTNVIAMESLAARKPTLLAGNTGLRELANDPRAVMLPEGPPSGCAPFAGWRDTDPGDIRDALEVLYAHRADPCSRWPAHVRSWETSVASFLHTITAILEPPDAALARRA